MVIEDAAQGLMSTYSDRALGSIGHLGAYSFHETKNIISGEGGRAAGQRPAAPSNAPRSSARRARTAARFFRGQVDKYTWVDIGSSYLPGEIVAAFLWAQMQEAEAITARRKALWESYHHVARAARAIGPRTATDHSRGSRPQRSHVLPPAADLKARTRFIGRLKEQGIQATFHYVPLHTAPMGERTGRMSSEMKHTVAAAERLVRLPLWLGLEEHQDRVVEEVVRAARVIRLDDTHAGRGRGRSADAWDSAASRRA